MGASHRVLAIQWRLDVTPSCTKDQTLRHQDLELGDNQNHHDATIVGGTNHLCRDCPFRGRSAPPEAVGNKAVNNAVPNKGGATGTISTTGKKVAMLTADQECKPSEDAISDNPKIEDTVDQAIATLHGIKPERKALIQIPGWGQPLQVK